MVFWLVGVPLAAGGETEGDPPFLPHGNASKKPLFAPRLFVRVCPFHVMSTSDSEAGSMLLAPTQILDSLSFHLSKPFTGYLLFG